MLVYHETVYAIPPRFANSSRGAAGNRHPVAAGLPVFGRDQSEINLPIGEFSRFGYTQLLPVGEDDFRVTARSDSIKDCYENIYSSFCIVCDC